MSYLLLVIYYYFDAYESFVYLANLIFANPFMMDLYSFRMRRVYSYAALFDKYLSKEGADLLEFFKKNCVNTMTFSIDWFYTLFSRSFDIHVTRVVWDQFLLYGPEFLFLLGTSIMNILRPQLLTEYMNEGFNYLRAQTGKLKISQILSHLSRHRLDYFNYLSTLEGVYALQPEIVKRDRENKE